MPPTLARYPRKHVTHATHASPPPMPPTLARTAPISQTRTSNNLCHYILHCEVCVCGLCGLCGQIEIQYVIRCFFLFLL